LEPLSKEIECIAGSLTKLSIGKLNLKVVLQQVSNELALVWSFPSDQGSAMSSAMNPASREAELVLSG
jgi:hypothetical protein